MTPPSPDQSLSSYNHIKNPNRNTRRHFISRSTENLAPIPNNTIQNGLLFSRPPSVFSWPSVKYVNPQQQPPLLPLPITTKPYYSSPLPLARRTRPPSVSCSPTNRNLNKIPKKSKPSSSSSSSTSPKKEDSKRLDFKSIQTTVPKEVPDCLIVASINRLGPDPNDLPKDVSRVLSSSASVAVNDVITNTVLADLEKFSGTVFTLSPPPSSLPLPKFSLRPKLSCNAEASGIDAGATDNLRRLLRIC